jgi:hypothetical protein
LERYENMTREKASVTLLYMQGNFSKEEYEALNMAIAELEKPAITEKVVEDIKAEISNLIDWHDCPIEYDGGCDTWYRTAINQALEIIDKHIGEEVKE